jgi:MoaA/NifB/PqqE/SkfB family radical SAM enzyme
MQNGILRKALPESLKPPVFHCLVWSYRLGSGIEPIRRRLLGPLKKANEYVARLDRRERRYKIRNYPVYVTVETAQRCNLACPMCFRQHRPKEVIREANTSLLPLENFRRIAALLFPFARTVNLSISGEPLLLPYLDDVLEIIARYECKLEIFTNMTPMADDALMDKVLPHIGVLRASIDGATKEIFEAIRRGAKFEPVMRALERFGRLRARMPGPRPAFGLHVVIQRDNVRQLPDLARLAARVGADFLSGDHVVVLSSSTRELSIVEDRELYRKFYRETRQSGEELGITIELPAPLPETTSDRSAGNGDRKPGENVRPGSSIECPFLWTHVLINLSGQSFACCHLNPPQYPGNVLENFRQVWDGPAARKIRRDYSTPEAHPSCRDCYLLAGTLVEPTTYHRESYGREYSAHGR